MKVGPKPRSQHAAIMLDDKLLIFGGISLDTKEKLDDGWIYDLTSQIWVKLSYTNP
jgi:N-acetylneuraminic acid mutarotase